MKRNFIDFNPQYRADSNPLLDRHRLGKVSREVNVEALHDSEPVCNQLQRNDVKDTLEDIHGLGDLNLLGLVGTELLVAGVANHNRLAATSNDCLNKG